MAEETTAPAEVTPTENGDTDKSVQITEVETEVKTEAPTEESGKTDDSDAVSDPAPAKPKKASKSQKKIANLEYQNREDKRRLDRLIGVIEKQNKTPSTDPPKIEDFESIDAFLDARDAHRDDKKSEKSDETPEQREYQHHVEASIEDLFDAGSEVYEDFEEVVTGDGITPIMRDALFEMDLNIQPDVAYYLGKNKKEAKRISRLEPMRQVLEIGKLEAKVTSKPTKRLSTAPAPITPVGGSKTSNDEIRDGMKFEDFVKVRNKQIGRT